MKKPKTKIYRSLAIIANQTTTNVHLIADYTVWTSERINGTNNNANDKPYYIVVKKIVVRITKPFAVCAYIFLSLFYRCVSVLVIILPVRTPSTRHIMLLQDTDADKLQEHEVVFDRRSGSDFLVRRDNDESLEPKADERENPV